MKKIHVNNLVLEITRKCNMKCMHCLRGPVQKLDMTNAIMDRVLNQIGFISAVTFTGGEPSLNVPAIEHFTQVCRSKKIAGRDRAIGPESFYVVTNGKKNARPLVDALIDLYDLCDNPDEESMTSLCMSRDQYHDEDLKIPGIFKALKFFREDDHAKRIEYVINEGRAKLNGLSGGREVSNNPFEVQTWGEDTIYVEMLYVSANGNVTSDCDLSYRTIDTTNHGNILLTPLIDIINNNKKET